MPLQKRHQTFGFKALCNFIIPGQLIISFLTLFFYFDALLFEELLVLPDLGLLYLDGLD